MRGATIPEMVQPRGQEFVEIQLTVEPNYAGWRLEHYLAEKLRRLPRERLLQLIATGLVGGEEKLKPSTLVRPGQVFRLLRPLREEPPTPSHVGEVYLDPWLLVLDKPSGLPVHPTARYHQGTVVSRLKQQYGPDFQAAPAHRLDRETSGLLVCGRTPDVCRALMHSFVAGEVRKEYLALVEGWPPLDTFTVDAPIAEGTALIRIAVRIDPLRGKPARTRFKVLERFSRQSEPFSLVRCFPETGRQHQIRIHLCEAGFPLVGDKMYGHDPGYFDRFSKHALEPADWAKLRLPRHALHATHLAFTHPGTGNLVSFDSPLPGDLQAFLTGQ